MTTITDLKICESSSGGDLRLNDAGDDIAVVEDLSNQPYLAMFGGNIEANTESDAEAEFKENFDWWGNNLLFPEDSLSQFNSDTERSLSENSLTSTGRTIIEQAVKSDVSFLNPENIEVNVLSLDKININVKVNEIFLFKWDCSGKERIIYPLLQVLGNKNDITIGDNNNIILL